MSMAFNVGELVAYLRLDMGDFERGMAKSQAQADKLDEKNIDVKVKADTALAESKLADVSAAGDKVDAKAVDVKVKADTAGAETKLAAVAAAQDRVGGSSGVVAKGMATAESAARRLADATAALSIADNRLFEVEYSGTAKTSTLLSARQAVEKAERNLADAENEVAAANDKVDASSKNASKGLGALANAIILLGPALVPIGAGVVGLIAGFGALGTAGVLAIVGIKQQMADGTVLGGQYATMLAGLKANLTTLGATAAGGVLGPFQSAVSDLQAKMPELNAVVGDFSAITGRAASSLMTGLVSAFLTLEPVVRDVGIYILGLSDRFAAMMSGPGVVTFGEYIRSVFPQVMQILTSIGDAALHLVAALAPLGMGTMTILQALSSVISAIPVPVLSALAQTATAAYIAINAFRLLTGPLAAFEAAMIADGVAADVAATGIRGLTMAAGIIGVALGAATILFSAFAESQRQNTQVANDYADALRQDNGAIGENTRAMAAKNLQDSGAAALGAKLGLTLSDLTGYALGNADAIAKVKAVTADATNVTTGFGTSTAKTGADAQALAGAANDLNDKLGIQNVALQDGIQRQKDYAAATATTTSVTDPLTIAQVELAAKIGTTTAALVTATAGQQTTAQAAADAAAKMYLENDAAGILRGQLDLLNGKALNAAQAQNAFDSSLANMGDHLTTTGKKITFTTTSIGDMSTASVALRGQLNSQVANLQAVVEANGGLSDSTGKAREQMVTLRQQIIDNAVAHGVNKDAVTAYIDKLLAIPATVPPTKLDVDTAAAAANIAAIKAQVAEIGARPVVIQFTANYSAAVQAVLGNARANITLNLPGHTGGGLLTGPGTGTSDSILGVNASGVPIARVSVGEFVVNAAATAKHRAELEAINSGQSGAGGGTSVAVYVQAIPDGEYVQQQAMVAINGVSSTATQLGRQAVASR